MDGRLSKYYRSTSFSHVHPPFAKICPFFRQWFSCEFCIDEGTVNSFTSAATVDRTVRSVLPPSPPTSGPSCPPTAWRGSTGGWRRTATSTPAACPSWTPTPRAGPSGRKGKPDAPPGQHRARPREGCGAAGGRVHSGFSWPHQVASRP